MAEKETRHQAYLTVYFCGSENCPPRHAYGPAVRPHYLLHVILKGRGIYQYKGQTYALSAGDAFLIPPAEVTYYQADEREPWSYAWVGFDGKAVPEILARTVFSEAFVFRKETPDSIAPLTDQMKKLCETFFQSPEDQLSAAGNLLLLFSFMKKKAPETSQEPTQIYLQKAKEYLENNYAYPIRISDVARYTGIDRTYLYRIFMEKEKLSPKQYLLRHRLRMAVEMLSAPPATPSPRSPSPAASTTPPPFPAVSERSFTSPPETSAKMPGWIPTGWFLPFFSRHKNSPPAVFTVRTGTFFILPSEKQKYL